MLCHRIANGHAIAELANGAVKLFDSGGMALLFELVFSPLVAAAWFLASVSRVRGGWRWRGLSIAAGVAAITAMGFSAIVATVDRDESGPFAPYAQATAALLAAVALAAIVSSKPRRPT